MTTDLEMFVAKRLCEAAGYQWPCSYDHYSIKCSKESVTKWWVELAEHAIAAVEQYEADHG